MTALIRSLRTMPAEVWVLFATTLVNRLGTMALPFLVLWLAKYSSFSVAQASCCIAVYGAGSLATMLLAGPACDRLGAPRVLQASLGGSGLLMVLFPLAQSLPMMYVLCALWSVFAEASRPASLLIVSQSVPVDRRKSAFALIRMAVNLGMMAGPVIGGLLLPVSRSAVFLIDGATSILAAVVFSTLLTRFSSGLPTETPGIPSRVPRSARMDWAFPAFLCALFPVALVSYQHQAALPVFLTRELGLSALAFGLLILINTALVLMLEVPLNVAIAHWRHPVCIAAGALLFGLGFGGFAFVRSFGSAAAAVVVLTFGEMILLPASAAYVAEAAPANQAGRYLAMYQMCFGLAFMIGPWLGAKLLEQYGSGTLWSAALGAGVLSAAAVLGLARSQKQRPRLDSAGVSMAT
jgi:MFS family permease